MEPPALRDRIRTWTEQHPGVFRFDETPDGARLAEVVTGKSLLVHADAVLDIVSRTNTETGRDYLVVQHRDRQPLALADAGFVFGLDTRNSGPLAGAPPVMSFRDFRRFHAHLLHLVEQPARRQEALDLMMILIASLDGARAAALPTEVEEGELEVLLRRLEAGS